MGRTPGTRLQFLTHLHRYCQHVDGGHGYRGQSGYDPADLCGDGRTLSLRDGRTLRLAGIEVTAASRAALRRLAMGKTLRLKKLGPDHDCYGRLAAFVFIGASDESLQQVLLAVGQARVGPRIGDPGCARTLLKSERAARAGSRGLWADPRFSPIIAGDLESGHFALVEGQVLSVHPSGGTIYLNFGRHWTRDFSVLILRRKRRTFTAAGIDPLRLKHRHLRVRGVVELRRGPIIEAEAPGQIELTDGASGGDK